MTRSALRRFLGTVALVALPVWTTGCSCPARGSGGTAVPFDFGIDGLTFIDDAGTLSPANCGRLCPDGGGAIPRCGLVPRFDAPEQTLLTCAPPGGAGFYSCGPGLGGGGRYPAGLRRPEPISSRHPVGALLAAMAHQEAAAVHGFRELESELRLHRAPDSLVRAARRAMHDEVRHARVTATLARRWGADEIPPVEFTPTAPRTLGAFAAENAEQGCVIETWSAVMAFVQGRRAADVRLRAAMARIADDEIRHAELGAAVAAWIEPLLDNAGRAEVAAARATALTSLERCLDEELAPCVRELAGLPSAGEARALFEDVRRTLWS